MEDMAPAPAAAREYAEADLLAGVRANDPDACEAFVRRYCAAMLAAARRVLRDEEDARDAVQDAFASAFRAVGRFDGRSALGTWLHRVAVNAALMKLRSRHRHPEQSIEPLLPHFGADEHHDRPPRSWGRPASEAAEREEDRRAVREAIDRLPDSYRTVLLLRDIEGLDTDEAARLLAVSTAVVKTRLHRARQALRTLLDPHFGSGPDT